MEAYILLVVLLIMSFSDIKKKNKSILAYLIFFQEIHILIFKRIGFDQFSLIFYIVLIFLFGITNLSTATTYSRIKFSFFNPIIFSIFLIIVMMIFHVVSYGFISEESYVLVTRFFLQIVPVILFIIIFVNDKLALVGLADGIIKYGLLFFLVIYFCTDLTQIVDLSRSDFREELGISPIQLSRTSGIIVIASFIFILMSKYSFSNVKYVIAFMIGLYFMVLGMSRGPFISLILTFFIISGFSKKINWTLVLLAFVTMGACLYLIFPLINFEFISRFQEFKDYESMLRFARIQLFFQYLGDFQTFLIGLGPEGFAFKSGLKYPHNFIMEVIIEYGVLGWLALFFFFYYSINYLKYILVFDFSIESVVLSSLFVFYLLASMVSGNLIANRALIFCSLILLNYYFIFRKNSVSHSRSL